MLKLHKINFLFIFKIQFNKLTIMKLTFGPQRLLLPLPTVLVVSGDMDSANIATIAWISMLTGNPPTLGISVGTMGFSGEIIKRNKNFTVNIASVDIIEESDFCGITSGKNTNKFEKSGLTKLPSKTINSPIIKECPVNFECKLVSYGIFGSTNHFVGEILETHIDTDKLNDVQKAGSVNIEAVNPLIYISGLREYREIGKRAGNAYKMGKKLLS